MPERRFRVIVEYDGTSSMTVGLPRVDIRPNTLLDGRGPASGTRAGTVSARALDGIGAPRPPADALVQMRAAAWHGPGHDLARPGVPLLTTRAAAAAIAAGEHQIHLVDGRVLRYPSQDLAKIESLRPDRPGQTHALERHVGTNLADNIARLRTEPLLHAAGSYTSLADAQYATDETIGNPVNQAAIGAFLADPGRLKAALLRVDLGRAVGSSTLQRDLAAGHPTLVPGNTATVVVIKDPTFPEGYRVLTTYPDIRSPELDARGTPLA